MKPLKVGDNVLDQRAHKIMNMMIGEDPKRPPCRGMVIAIMNSGFIVHWDPSPLRPLPCDEKHDWKMLELGIEKEIKEQVK